MGRNEYKAGEFYTMVWRHRKEPPYPWNPQQHIPIKIIEDYGKWVLCEVQPHKAKPFCFDVSRPYKITFDKSDIVSEDMALY